jgi:PAS domain-containing protein
MEGEMPANPKKRTPESQDALAYAENIIATLREPFVVLDKSLRVHTANTALYRDFHASKEEPEGRFVYELGNGQWDIPQLRTFLVQVLSNSHAVEDFEAEHTFPGIGRRKSDNPDLVLLAIEHRGHTDQRRAEAAMKDSEVRYRRRFLTAQDGILSLDADTTGTEGRVTFLNPVAESLTGWTPPEAAGELLESVVRVVNEGSRQPVESPTVRALRDGVISGLTTRTLRCSG